MAEYVLPTFKAVSIIFAFAAVGTGLQALLDPIGFSNTFGLPLDAVAPPLNTRVTATAKATLNRTMQTAKSYVSLMGVRQLGTGLIILTFGYQGKWMEVATILAIIGIVVAGTDGLYLASGGQGAQARWHAIPGALISVLSMAVLLGAR